MHTTHTTPKPQNPKTPKHLELDTIFIMESSGSEKLQYQVGFGNHHATECLPDALPKAMNCPQKVNYGLYAEQLTGTPFTYARHKNQRTYAIAKSNDENRWTYRIQPTVLHKPFKPCPAERFARWFTEFERENPHLHVSPQ